MAKKINKINDNTLESVEKIVCAAKKRRRMSILAIQQLNNEAGGEANIYLAK